MVINRKIFQPGFLDRFGIITLAGCPPCPPCPPVSAGPFGTGQTGLMLGEAEAVDNLGISGSGSITHGPMFKQLTASTGIMIAFRSSARITGVTEVNGIRPKFNTNINITLGAEDLTIVRADDTTAVVNHRNPSGGSEVRVYTNAGTPSQSEGSIQIIDALWTTDIYMDILDDDKFIFVGKTAADLTQFRVVTGIISGPIVIGDAVDIETNASGKGIVRTIAPDRAVFAHQQADLTSSAWAPHNLGTTDDISSELQITTVAGIASQVSCDRLSADRAVVIASGSSSSPAVGRVIQDVGASPSFLNTFNVTVDNNDTVGLEAAVAMNGGADLTVILQRIVPDRYNQIVISDIQGSPTIEYEALMQDDHFGPPVAAAVTSIFNSGPFVTSNVIGMCGIDAALSSLAFGRIA